MSSTSVYFSFVKDGEDDVNTPCWAQLDVLSAFNQAKGNTSCFTLKILNHRRFSKSVTRKVIVQFFHKAERELHKLHGNEGKVTYIQEWCSSGIRLQISNKNPCYLLSESFLSVEGSFIYQLIVFAIALDSN